VIAHAVPLYLRFALSYRDVEELLAERGIAVSYETVRAWVRTFVALYAASCGGARGASAGRGTSTRWWCGSAAGCMALARGRRARADARRPPAGAPRHAAAARFFRRLLGITGAAPNRITTDKLGSYAAALAQLPPMREVEHLQVGPPCAATTAWSRPTRPPASASA
jgi:putative transposase